MTSSLKRLPTSVVSFLSEGESLVNHLQGRGTQSKKTAITRAGVITPMRALRVVAGISNVGAPYLIKAATTIEIPINLINKTILTD